jgi:hypothetical protein
MGLREKWEKKKRKKWLNGRQAVGGMAGERPAVGRGDGGFVMGDGDFGY